MSTEFAAVRQEMRTEFVSVREETRQIVDQSARGVVVALTEALGEVDSASRARDELLAAGIGRLETRVERIEGNVAEIKADVRLLRDTDRTHDERLGRLEQTVRPGRRRRAAPAGR
jgi:hypothetical protein